MKFSIIYEAQMVDTSRANEAQVFQDMVDQSVLAEEMGFDCIWSVEHHCLTQYAHLSAPESFLAFVAGRTTRIHVGHGVVCLPFKMNHPIKVAERVATLDLLSRGRLHLGVGKGGTFQDPHPLMYMACTREEALTIAGSRGLGALVLGFSGPDEIAKKNAIYRAAYKSRKPEDQVGFRPHQHLAALCPAVILDDREKAKRIGTRGQRFFAESIRYWYAGGEKPSIDDLDADVQIAAMEKNREQIVAYLGQEKIPVTDAATSNYHIEEDAYGSVEQAIRYVQRLVDAGADEILFLVQMGTIPHEVTMETIRNIGKHLIPHFKDKLAVAAE